MDVPIYRVDGLVRRAPGLQHTLDNREKPVAGMNETQFAEFNLQDGKLMNVVTPEGQGITIEVCADSRVPVNCIYVPSGYSQTAPLGAATRVALEEV